MISTLIFLMGKVSSRQVQIGHINREIKAIKKREVGGNPKYQNKDRNEYFFIDLPVDSTRWGGGNQ